MTLTDGDNTFTAIAQDSYGRTDTNTITVYLPATATFFYDERGNLTNDGRRILYYDAENQLVSVTASNAWRTEFQYDGFMRRRVRKEFSWTGTAWNLTNAVRYLYDGRLVVQERDANNLALVTYTRGNDLSSTMEGAGGIGGLLARSTQSTINSPHSTAFYHCDGNGNITALISSNQIIVARYHYDPYGNTLSASGPSAEANLYRFSSKEYHPESGLLYYLYRYYDANLQRWVNRDPIEEAGGINLFGVVFNRPSGLTDFWGLSAEDVEKILNACKQRIKELTDEGKRLSNGGVNNAKKSLLRDKKLLGCGEQAADVANKLSELKTDDQWTIHAVFVQGSIVPNLAPHQFLMVGSDNPKDPILYLDPHGGKCGKKPPTFFQMESIDELGKTQYTRNDKKPGEAGGNSKTNPPSLKQ